MQKTYARYGAGLAVLSKNHTLDDIISNRIFEITSVGAAAICPDIPWIRKLVRRHRLVLRPLRHGLRDQSPRSTRPWPPSPPIPPPPPQRAAEARGVFEREFCGEVLLANAVDYFERWRASPHRARPAAESPLIDVIVRVGGRPVETVLRAIRSIDGQSAGRFRLIIVRYKPLDVRAITQARWERIEGCEVVDCLGGQRAATLCAGLKAVRSELFACLDDDDYWLADHMRGLLDQAAQLPQGRVYAYSGLLNVTEGAPDPSVEHRRIASMASAGGKIEDVLGVFGPHSFLASSTPS